MSSRDESTESGALDANWRARVAEIGRRNFENEEMFRLGFLTEESLQRVAAAEGSLEAYWTVVKELGAVRRELSAVETEIGNLPDFDALLAEIRSRRIERVKAEREERRACKQAERAVREAEIRRRRVEEPSFLGRGVSHHLIFAGGDPAAVAERGLPGLDTFMDLAGVLELTPQQLQWLAYERSSDDTDHYTRFEIPKRSGGMRLISSPKPAMRRAQQWIREMILKPLPVGPAATAFRPGISIVDNARQHADAEVVVRIDLKDFFPTITFDRVRGFFQSLGYNPGVSTVLALLCTDAPRARVSMDGQVSYVIIGKRGLPQGACTSPDLANLIAAGLDARLVGLAKAFGWTYTRYADDLVFSSRSDDPDAARLVHAVTRIAGDEGFQVNDRKTRIMRSPNRQTVTGLLVNDQVRLTRQDLRRIRAFLHRCETRGVEAVSQETGKDAVAVARGYYAYVHMVMPVAAARMRQQHPWIGR